MSFFRAFLETYNVRKNEKTGLVRVWRKDEMKTHEEDFTIYLWTVHGVKECSMCEEFDLLPFGALLEDDRSQETCPNCGSDLGEEMGGVCWEGGIGVELPDQFEEARGFLKGFTFEQAREWVEKTFPSASIRVQR